MKTSHLKLLFGFLILAALPAGNLFADTNSEPKGRLPKLDADGRFWVYRNGPDHPIMPFLPYGWASDGSNLTRIIHIDLRYPEHPNTSVKYAGPPERNFCMQFKIDWDDATWASIAFISGSDKPAWWGATPSGHYYNLSKLSKKKKLVFFARGDKGGETIKGQIGMLSDKPYGDSLTKPLVTEDMKLTTEWIRFEIDLNGLSVSEIGGICNGFGVIGERASQPGSPTETVFYIDDVYFE